MSAEISECNDRAALPPNEVDCDPETEGREIPGFPRYYVTADGYIWRKYLGRARDKGKIPHRWKRLKPTPDRRGYSQCYLSNHCKVKTCKVHRIVLLCFVGPCPDNMECCHNDGVNNNNKLSNLRWDTKKNNAADKLKHGSLNHGEVNGQSKLKNTDIPAIREMLENGLSAIEIAAKYDVCKETIWRIKRRSHWKYV